MIDFKDIIIRAVKTFAQAAVAFSAALNTALLENQLDYANAFKLAAAAAGVSIFHNLGIAAWGEKIKALVIEAYLSKKDVGEAM